MKRPAVTPSWSAPVPPWAWDRASCREGKPLNAAAVMLLTYLWSRADAPSKRGPGPTFLRPCWRLSNADLARSLRRDITSIERQFAALVKAGLVRRGTKEVDGVEEAGVWLADLEVGVFPSTTRVSAGRPPASARVDHPRQLGSTTRVSAGRIKEARSIPDQARSIPDQARSIPDPRKTKMARPKKQDAKQETLFDEEPPQETALRDPAFEVFEYLAQRLYVTKRDLKLPTQGLRVLGAKSRKLIQAMIDAYSYELDEDGKRTGRVDVELGIAACRQVIEVDEADARRTGNFTFWDAMTPFRPDNFGSRLSRWRPDGKHAAFGVVEARGGTGSAPSSGRGWAEPEFTVRTYGEKP